jgi:acetyl-CoA carboxylase carboxyltransferase component
VTSPQVIKAVMYTDMTKDELGGAEAQTTRSGVAHFSVADDRACMALIAQLLSYLPSNNHEDAPFVPTDDPVDRQDAALDALVPTDPRRPYDIRDLISGVVDEGRFLEHQASFAPNMVIGFARLGGMSVGVVANQPLHLAGSIDIDASTKAARFVRFCDCFNLPLLTFVDVPGFLPGIDQEYGGIIRHGAKLIFAYGEATVPKITVVVRKAYGGAYVVMGSKHLRADMNFAYPMAEIAVMGPDAAVDFVYKEDLARAADPAQVRAERIEAYRTELAHPYRAAAWGAIDDVIRPSETRPRVISALRSLLDKRSQLPPKKHSNMPL